MVITKGVLNPNKIATLIKIIVCLVLLNAQKVDTKISLQSRNRWSPTNSWTRLKKPNRLVSVPRHACTNSCHASRPLEHNVDAPVHADGADFPGNLHLHLLSAAHPAPRPPHANVSVVRRQHARRCSTLPGAGVLPDLPRAGFFLRTISAVVLLVPNFMPFNAKTSAGAHARRLAQQPDRILSLPPLPVRV